MVFIQLQWEFLLSWFFPILSFVLIFFHLTDTALQNRRRSSRQFWNWDLSTPTSPGKWKISLFKCTMYAFLVILRRLSTKHSVDTKTFAPFFFWDPLGLSGKFVGCSSSSYRSSQVFNQIDVKIMLFCRYWRRKWNTGWLNMIAMWNRSSMSWMFWRFVHLRTSKFSLHYRCVIKQRGNNVQRNAWQWVMRIKCLSLLVNFIL